MRGLLVVRRPADAHHLGHGAHEAVAAGLVALAARIPGGRIEAGAVVALRTDAAAAVHEALALAAVPGVAVAVGAGPVALADGSPVGHAVGRTRRLCELARVGEVWLLDGVEAPIPAGVGTFDAPSALSAAVGGPVRGLRDHR